MLEKISDIAGIGSFLIAIIALFCGGKALCKVKKIEKKQEANNNVNSKINMNQ